MSNALPGTAGSSSEIIKRFFGLPFREYDLYNSRVRYSGVVAILKPEIEMTELFLMCEIGVETLTTLENI